MLVPRKHWKLGLVIDFRQFTKQTIKFSWPLPNIEEMFDTLVGSSYFSTIDMTAGCQCASKGAPTPSKACWNMFFRAHMETCVPYLDDCIIFPKTVKEHISRPRVTL